MGLKLSLDTLGQIKLRSKNSGRVEKNVQGPTTDRISGRQLLTKKI